MILYQGRTFKSYRGMGSMGAMAQGSSERYFQSTEGDASTAVSARTETPTVWQSLFRKALRAAFLIAVPSP